MKKLTVISILAMVALMLVVNGQASALTIPTTSIQGVTANDKVTIVTYNFPANLDFEVRMGLFGTKGVDGILIGTINSGTGGSLKLTFPIPPSLYTESMIAIRLQSAYGGYYAYDWFYNTDYGSHTGGVELEDVALGAAISATSVVSGETVTIKGTNLPVNEDFKVLMGVYGTQGVGGTEVGTVSSGASGEVTKTFDIPASLTNDYKIAIRFQSEDSSLVLYTWFQNIVGASGGMGGITTTYYTGIPTISILEVNKDQDVTIKTNNYPANKDFTVLMGKIGTRGVGGIVVTTINSGEGGSFEKTFDIPAALHGDYQIAIRLQTADNYFYSYDWFYNSPDAAPSPPTATGTPAPTTTLPGYTGIPTISITAVVKDSKVTILTNNFPAGFTWTVRMGKMYTQGVNGVEVATITSAEGGAFSKTFNIPAELAGESMISIRLESTVGGFYAYDWFYNVTKP